MQQSKQSSPGPAWTNGATWGQFEDFQPTFSGRQVGPAPNLDELESGESREPEHEEKRSL